MANARTMPAEVPIVKPEARPDTRWRLIGARPCLDFVNTVGGREDDGAVRRDDIPDYDSLLRWSAFASLVEPAEVERLRARGRRSAAAARAALQRAVRLREALYRIGTSLADERSPDAAELGVLDRELREAQRHQ